MVKGVTKNHTLDKLGLEIQATEKLEVFMNNNIGYIGFSYNSYSESPYQYKIDHCQREYVSFEKQPGPATNSINTWKVIKTQESLIIECNGEQLVELMFNQDDECAAMWASVVYDFAFSKDHDKASKFYRPFCKY